MLRPLFKKVYTSVSTLVDYLPDSEMAEFIWDLFKTLTGLISCYTLLLKAPDSSLQLNMVFTLTAMSEV